MNRTRPIQELDPESIFRDWLQEFEAILLRRDGEALARLCGDESYFKDILALEWNFRTHSGPGEIQRALHDGIDSRNFRDFHIAPNRTAPALVRRAGRDLLEGYFSFSTDIGVCDGFVRLVYGDGNPATAKIWQMLFALNHIHGFADKAGENRPRGDNYSQITSPFNWRHDRDRERNFADRDPQALIVGAGQSGLMLAARLKQMGVDALVIERTGRVGDVWRERYNNLTLHNELTANHFPYMPFPETWPVWLPKDMMASWLEAYAECMELNVWTQTELVNHSYDSDAKMWSVTLQLADGTRRQMRTPHLIVAFGVSGGAPRRPNLPGLDDFKGKIVHSGEFRTGQEWAGKRALVIGTGNSGHDVAQDLYVSGAEVAIMQRGPTCVVSLEPSAAISYSVFAEGRPVDDVDLMIASIPYPVLIDTYQHITRRTNEYDKELLEGLKAVGFKLTSGEDNTGFQLLYLRGAGGYYIDVGCSPLIIERKIALLQAEDMDRFVRDGLRMKDGSVVPFDLVVTATGFEGMQSSIRSLLGDEIAGNIGPIWGFDEEFNMRNMWKRTNQEGFWIMGGAITEARLFSRYLALQIRASLDGLMSA